VIDSWKKRRHNKNTLFYKYKKCIYKFLKIKDLKISKISGNICHIDVMHKRSSERY